MTKREKIISMAISSFITLTASQATLAATSETNAQNFEKCYGIVKAGMNDCSTAKSSCSGSATKDRQADAFLFVPTGLCKKISGGSLTATMDKK